MTTQAGSKKVVVKAKDTWESRKDHVSSSQKQRANRRGSPEAHMEHFQRKPKKGHKSVSSIRGLTFVKHGGTVIYEGKVVRLTNTCNLDGVLMVLQALWYYSTNGRKFIEKILLSDPLTSTVVSIIEKISDGRASEAKLQWWVDVLKLGVQDDLINMHGSTYSI
jgi:hypothetical protein